MGPVIPHLAGEIIIIAKIDYGLHLWTADSLGDRPRRTGAGQWHRNGAH
jgi:hypothetical protein